MMLTAIAWFHSTSIFSKISILQMVDATILLLEKFNNNLNIVTINTCYNAGTHLQVHCRIHTKHCKFSIIFLSRQGRQRRIYFINILQRKKPNTIMSFVLRSTSINNYLKKCIFLTTSNKIHKRAIK